MGFADFLKDVGSSVHTNIQKRNEKIQQYKERYERYDDDFLKKAFKNSSGEKMLAIGMILRERGYGRND